MRRGEWMVLAGALALAIGSFLPWWTAFDAVPVEGLTEQLRKVVPDATVQSFGSSIELTMWDLDVLPWLAVIAFVSAGCLLLATWFGRVPRLAIVASVPTSWFGFWVAVVTFVRIFDAPVPGAENRYGIYVSLAGAVLLWLGGWDSMRDERVPAAMDHSPSPEKISMEQLDAEASMLKQRRAT
jgi:hypothetical protein